MLNVLYILPVCKAAAVNRSHHVAEVPEHLLPSTLQVLFGKQKQLMAHVLGPNQQPAPITVRLSNYAVSKLHIRQLKSSSIGEHLTSPGLHVLTFPSAKVLRLRTVPQWSRQQQLMIKSSCLDKVQHVLGCMQAGLSHLQPYHIVTICMN